MIVATKKKKIVVKSFSASHVSLVPEGMLPDCFQSERLLALPATRASGYFKSYNVFSMKTHLAVGWRYSNTKRERGELLQSRNLILASAELYNISFAQKAHVKV